MEDMNRDDWQILVVHTPSRAAGLKQILESHGVECVTSAVLMPPHSDIPEAVAISVSPTSLPLALKITESAAPYSPALIEMKLAGMTGNVLIPVDFSSYSPLACKVGFELAKRLNLHPALIHSFTTPVEMGPLMASTDLYGVGDNQINNIIEESLLDKDIQSEATAEMRRFVRKIKDMQAKGEMPDAKFSIILREGLPEEVISEYVRNSKPALIVMATRGTHKKEQQMIGSVTAEVIDNCRVPIFTVPEDYHFPGVENITNLGFFCNLDSADLLTMEALMHMFDFPDIKVTLIPAPNKQLKAHVIVEKLNALRDYFTNTYPMSKFNVVAFNPKDYRKDLEDYVSKSQPELLLIPNKKKNIFSRLFNPGIAHRILFERDIPMFVLPI